MAQLLTVGAFLHTRRLARRLRSRGDLDAWQARRLRHFLRHIAPSVDAFAGLDTDRLQDLPLMDKAALMAGFERYNRARITADAGWRALAGSRTIQSLHVGASTGTSGNRGLYLVSDRERFTWLGVMLAKALPDVLRARHRVAVILPTSSRLYDAANESGRLQLTFFDLAEGLDLVLPAVAAFGPTVIVAPPKVLVALAQADLPLSPKRLFSAAEVLDPTDRTIVEARFGMTLGQIYMATEGLLGVSCESGSLHLAEDAVAFEWETAGDLAKPVITDFTRRTQVMARYRMNDLLRLSDAPCSCGSPLRVVREVAGRMDDAFVLRRGQGVVTITPDMIRNAVIDTDRSISDFRVIQTAPDAVRLLLPPGSAARLPPAIAALHQLFARLGAEVTVTGRLEPLAPPMDHKLRRVMRMQGTQS
jgi:putative adenylate-forming enzyme